MSSGSDCCLHLRRHRKQTTGDDFDAWLSRKFQSPTDRTARLQYIFAPKYPVNTRRSRGYQDDLGLIYQPRGTSQRVAMMLSLFEFHNVVSRPYRGPKNGGKDLRRVPRRSKIGTMARGESVAASSSPVLEEAACFRGIVEFD